jgi:subtilisin family serine protease
LGREPGGPTAEILPSVQSPIGKKLQKMDFCCHKRQKFPNGRRKAAVTAAGKIQPHSAMSKPKHPKSITDVSFHSLQPQLRVFANGDSVVNTIRAERCGSLVSSAKLLRQVPAGLQDEAPVALQSLPKAVVRHRKLKAVPDDVRVSVFVHKRKDSDGDSKPLPGETAEAERLVTLELPLSQLKEIAARPDVVFVERGQPLSRPLPQLGDQSPAVPSVVERRVGKAEKHHHGSGVLVGIIDVQGFDFSHPDFLDATGKTRFDRIWDQGGDFRPPPGSIKGSTFDYGAEFKKDHLNAAIQNAPSLGVAATDLEKQSSMEPGSHGTHVASIAAGNRGIARQATIAAVLVDLPAEDLDRRKSFYDSTRIAHAVDYLLAVGEDLGLPVSINISLGTNGHAHDGSSAVSRWIDHRLTMPGRSVCVATGNAGQEKGENDDDLGWIMGRIHTSGRIPSAGLTRDIEWTVVGNGMADISENELEIWFPSQDRLTVSIRPPGGSWVGPVRANEFIENHRLANGGVLSVYSELYHPSNGSNYISIYLSPFITDQGIVGVTAGTWTIRLQGEEIRDGKFDGWIERDDPRPIHQPPGERELWAFPSFFTENSNVDDSSISSLATGNNVIGVANLHEAAERVNISSSQGPTRDGRSKPEVAAPGTDIVAANGFAGEEHQWVGMTGTSMASPYVCGVAALMLAAEKRLTASQIIGILRRTSRPLPGATFQWRNDAGFGVIDPEACVSEAALIFQRKDLKP